mmetsp:Transcript_17591/g.30821  ORF Transcript_17591/g.30821 Transcript_17591/m.30821 type:complete len:263 (+) Transcript_17591:344-1132(+)
MPCTKSSTALLLITWKRRNTKRQLHSTKKTPTGSSKSLSIFVEVCTSWLMRAEPSCRLRLFEPCRNRCNLMFVTSQHRPKVRVGPCLLCLPWRINLPSSRNSVPKSPIKMTRSKIKSGSSNNSNESLRRRWRSSGLSAWRFLLLQSSVNSNKGLNPYRSRQILGCLLEGKMEEPSMQMKIATTPSPGRRRSRKVLETQKRSVLGDLERMERMMDLLELSMVAPGGKWFRKSSRKEEDQVKQRWSTPGLIPKSCAVCKLNWSC